MIRRFCKWFVFKLRPQTKDLSQDEIDHIVRLALGVGDHGHLRAKAIESYRQALDRGVPLRSNVHMSYMAEVDHPCPDFMLLKHYREEIRAQNEKISTSATCGE